ncbi:MAG: MATE family efflux transporter, partial [Lachnospiraceae bacterium]|nr:MATE family efflux transporter [Lachnospiraceae bacterium]
MDKTNTGKPAKKIILEQLEPGTDDDLKVQKISSTLPEGISSRDVYKDILRIALPASVELMLSSLVSMVDLMMVGGLGTWAITSVG